MVTVLLILMKLSNVLSNVKMNGELNTVQMLNLSIVQIHSLNHNVMVLGLVKISITSLLQQLNLMILTVMETSMSVISLKIKMEPTFTT